MNKYFDVGDQHFVELPDGTQLRRLTVAVVGSTGSGMRRRHSRIGAPV